MRMRIYQIDPKMDRMNVKCKSFREIDEIDPGIYKKVFDAEADVKHLEGAFSLFNSVAPHPLYYGNAMTVSDVVVTEQGAFYCDTKGFQRIGFDETQTNQNENIRVLFVEPHEKPYVAEIPDTLEAKQRAVGGYIEFVYGDDDEVALISDEEAKLKCKEGNRYLDDGGIIAGAFLVVGLTEDGCRSLTDEEVEKYLKKYDEAPDISREETEADMDVYVISM